MQASRLRWPLAGPATLATLTTLAMLASAVAPLAAQGAFDHDYRGYAALLQEHVRGDRVDYRSLQADRGSLEAVVGGFDRVSESDVQAWTRPQQIAFWINAYNVFTLDAIVDHYPIRGSWFSLQPRNSIRQIDGVWTSLTWRAAGRAVTLDDIEHRILRPVFREPLVHFAINCASVSCPPLAADPYRGADLEAQLEAAARRFLASPLGLTVRGATLSVSSIFKWYGEDFVERYAGSGTAARPATEQAILGVVARFGPGEARAVAARADARVRYLRYDWLLNDVHAR